MAKDDIGGLLIRVSQEVQQKLDDLYAKAGEPEPGSALDQAGLRDGLETVVDYIEHNECGLALDHLLYMIEEPTIPLSQSAARDLTAVAKLLNKAVPDALAGALSEK